MPYVRSQIQRRQVRNNRPLFRRTGITRRVRPTAVRMQRMRTRMPPARMYRRVRR